MAQPYDLLQQSLESEELHDTVYDVLLDNFDFDTDIGPEELFEYEELVRMALRRGRATPVARDDTNWFNEPPHPPPPPPSPDYTQSRQTPAPEAPAKTGPKSSGLGPRPLLDMAMTKLLENVMEVPDSGLDPVPVHILLRAWKQVQERGVSLSDWKAFVGTLVERDSAAPVTLYQFFEHIPNPTAKLSVYTTPLDSSSCMFITYLSIHGNFHFNTEEFLGLAGMTNLGVLEITDMSTDRYPKTYQYQVNDMLLKGWSEKPGAFPALRILRIQAAGNLVSKLSLHYVSGFPSLAVFQVKLCDFQMRTDRRYARDLGWQVSGGPVRRDIVGILRGLKSIPRRGSTWKYPRYETDFELESILATIFTQKGARIHIHPPSVFGRLDWKTFFDRYCGEKAPQDSGEPDFGTWAFWLYAAVGHKISNSDLPERVRRTLERPVHLEGLEVSPVPIACLQLGEQPPYGLNEDEIKQLAPGLLRKGRKKGRNNVSKQGRKRRVGRLLPDDPRRGRTFIFVRSPTGRPSAPEDTVHAGTEDQGHGGSSTQHGA